jgi:formate hydrogenlyase transcriptional activator
LKDVDQVASTDSTVLVTGETGTGKELIARAIHQRSARRDKQLVKVNCAAISAGLVESEFFGHEKGAFTGATRKREGRFSLADGGTIFLDEVGELPLDLQVKLLRVLQEGEFEPVGSSQTHYADVRVVAATNRDIEQMVKDGTFREDLYYRLNVFPIRVPPLRERGDDVVLLAEAFLSRFARRAGRKMASLTPASRERLCAYEWPGNVRELQNVIERAFITGSDRHINLDRALPDAVVRDVTTPGEATRSISDEPIRTAEQLQALERDNIERGLAACRWKISGEAGAARLLGMNPSTLSSRMRALGIKRSNS